MRLDLSEITRDPGERVKQEIEEPCFPEQVDLDCVTPIKGEIEISNTGELLLLQGEIKTTVRLQCSRCVTDLVVPLEAKIDEQFRLVHVGDRILALPMEDEEELEGVISGNILDTGELVRQTLLTEVPIQPLCTPDCKGLCPECGQNLNEAQCVCSAELKESPFSALADLLKEEDKTED